MKSSIITIFAFFLCWLIAGCGDEGDPIPKCSSFRLKTIFWNSIGDITGDTIGENVQFLKDSITYEVVSSFVTVPITKPIVTRVVSNTFTTLPFDISEISNNGTVLVIYHFNASVSDTLRVEITNKTNFNLFNKNGPVVFARSGDCQLSLYFTR